MFGTTGVETKEERFTRILSERIENSAIPNHRRREVTNRCYLRVAVSYPRLMVGGSDLNGRVEEVLDGVIDSVDREVRNEDMSLGRSGTRSGVVELYPDAFVAQTPTPEEALLAKEEPPRESGLTLEQKEKLQSYDSAKRLADKERNHQTLLRNLEWWKRKKVDSLTYEAISQETNSPQGTIKTGVRAADLYIKNKVHGYIAPSESTNTIPEELDAVVKMYNDPNAKPKVKATLENLRAEFSRHPIWNKVYMWLLYDQGDYQAAVQYLWRGLGHADDAEMRMELYNNLAECYREMKALEEARYYWERAYNVYPKDPTPPLNLLFDASKARNLERCKLWLNSLADVKRRGVSEEMWGYVIGRLKEKGDLEWLRTKSPWSKARRWIREHEGRIQPAPSPLPLTPVRNVYRLDGVGGFLVPLLGLVSVALGLAIGAMPSSSTITPVVCNEIAHLTPLLEPAIPDLSECYEIPVALVGDRKAAEHTPGDSAESHLPRELQDDEASCPSLGDDHAAGLLASGDRKKVPSETAPSSTVHELPSSTAPLLVENTDRKDKDARAPQPLATA